MLRIRLELGGNFRDRRKHRRLHRTFQRQGQPTTSGIATGYIPLQPLEIARLDNDPNYPEHGLLTVNVCGGN